MDRERILMGVVGRPHGVRGLVRVHSYAAVPEDLTAYGALIDEHGQVWSLRWRGDGIAELRDAAGQALSGRDAAQAMVNRRLYVARTSLPEPDQDEFYFTDLIGMDVRAQGTDAPLGRVLVVHDYGAGVSLELGGQGHAPLILPFTRACFPVVDVAAGRIEAVLPDEIEVQGDLSDKGEVEVSATGGAS
ncbi:16S rRNA processing protein RimM [Gluconacetobacter diazotrophicus PA1 5]|uniref:ribosome maturation factor RimM n=1 Tax=Gluconacetobacter diazotrophicus TaxID=33996 RepID=UPI000173D539|nr:ribosome maturation factor RimM [Gluconacetobacter diazotrophicus]ACI53004.1 16S rRNA processing protein RimM [Gluconacetobacter diazotrophicus PA1 5]TWB07675.1 16S rRNA processing protein RimM [Gluconacetobacter diazotrophicus]